MCAKLRNNDFQGEFHRWESVEVAAADIQAAEQRGEVMQLAGDEVLYAAFRFQFAFDHQQLRFQERTALAFGQLTPDDHVDHAVLVLQGDEGDPAGGLRSLPADHQACGADVPARRDFRQLL